MEHKKALTASRKCVLVPKDKFDRHMKRARRITGESRKSIFDRLTEDGLKRKETITKLTSSIY